MSRAEVVREIHKSIRRLRRERGNDSESMADDALNWLQARGIITTWWPANWNEDHKEGVDRIVQLVNGAERPLQVKSSPRGKEEACEHHPEIPCVVIDTQLPVEDNAWHIFRVVRTN
jgi:hypothetical protein